MNHLEGPGSVPELDKGIIGAPYPDLSAINLPQAQARFPADTVLDPQLIHQLIAEISQHVLSEHKIDLHLTSLKGTTVGISNGHTLLLDYDKGGERIVFFAAHGFGHLVQRWTDPHAENVLVERKSFDSVQQSELLRYELEASQYGASLLKEIGRFDQLHDWYNRWAIAEYDYMTRFVIGRYDQPVQSFLTETIPHARRIEPKEIPPFEPEAGVFLNPAYRFWL